jgi:hypothetical protein
MDMLRFHRFTIGHAWITDYGSPDVAADFAVLRAYSPLHNVATPKVRTCNVRRVPLTHPLAYIPILPPSVLSVASSLLLTRAH